MMKLIGEIALEGGVKGHNVKGNYLIGKRCLSGQGASIQR